MPDRDDAAHLPAGPTRDPAWVLVEEGFELAREHEVESLFALGNGYAGTRGSLAEGSRLSAPATYLAGVYAVPPGPEAIPALANVGDWTHLHLELDGKRLALDAAATLEHRRTLDLRQAILWRHWRHRDELGRITSIRALRLLSLADRHLFVQSVLVEAENYDGRLGVDLSLEGERELGPFSIREIVPPQSGVTVAMAAVALVDGELRSGTRFSLDLAAGVPRRLDRFVVVYTSRDGVPSPLDRATTHLRDAIARGIDAAVDAHIRAWDERWRASDVTIDGDLDAQRAVRFAIYHLVSAANSEDDRVSIGARGLTGDAYKGHVFWDTDVYMLPFFAFTYSEAARALVRYRYHTLPAARRRALRAGCRGALFAWESAVTGDDVTPSFVLRPDGTIERIRVGELAHHISADVAWAVWTYWQATGDDHLLEHEGIEILVETARFWASRATREEDGLHHIRNVIGPDEYHVAVDDNAYTNVMAQWNLERAAEIVRAFPAAARRLGIAPDEPAHWEHVAASMYTGFDPTKGLFEQFRGYFQLEPLDLEDLEPRVAPVDVLLGRERLRRSQVIKQADVVMLLHLLWDRFPPDVREANFRYYEPRCAHGSSLSPAIHAAVAARLGDTSLAERYFRQAAEIDLANNMGNAAGGVHVGGLGALWQTVLFGFAGMRTTTSPDSPTFHPHLPHRWRFLEMSITWRGRPIRAHLSPEAGPLGADEVFA